MVMSQKVKVYHLYPDSTVQTSKGSKKPEFPNMVLTTHGGKSMGLLLQQNPTFTESKPTVLRYFICPPCVSNAQEGQTAAPLECEGCLLTSPAPSPSLRDNGRMMLCQANDPFPLSCQEPMNLGEKHALGQSIDEEMQQAAQNAASRDDLGYDSKRSMFMLLMGLAVFFSLIFGFAMWNSLIFKGDAAVEPVPEPTGVERLYPMRQQKNG
jgi:hypothetical protein